jgi:hypothetical protein
MKPINAIADGLEATAEAIAPLAGSGVSLGVWLIGSDITLVIPLSKIDELTEERLYALAEDLRNYNIPNNTRMSDGLAVMANTLIAYDTARGSSNGITAIQRIVVISDCKDEYGVFTPAIPFSELCKYLANPALGIQRIPIAMRTNDLDTAAINMIVPSDAIDGSESKTPSIDEMAAEIRTQLLYIFR